LEGQEKKDLPPKGGAVRSRRGSGAADEVNPVSLAVLARSHPAEGGAAPHGQRVNVSGRGRVPESRGLGGSEDPRLGSDVARGEG
jgi:hypothetical protein